MSMSRAASQRTGTRVRAVVGFLLALSAGLFWEDSHSARPTASPGAKLRVKTLQQVDHFYGTREQKTGWITGTLVSLTPSTAVLVTEEPSDTVLIDRDTIVSAEVSMSYATRRGQGKFIGLLAGVAIVLALPRDNGSSDFDSMFEHALLRGFLDVSIAAGVVALGGFVGSRMKYEQWERVQAWPAVEAAARNSPVSTPIGISVALRF